MEKFYNAAVLWFVAGFIFFILEFLIPGLILFFFAVGAWIVAILLLFVDLSINMQLTAFLVSSVLTILLFRKGMKQLMWSRKMSSEIEDEFLGKTGRAQTHISSERMGKVEFKGTVWDATSQDTIQPGDNVTIIGNDSIILIVKSTQRL